MEDLRSVCKLLTRGNHMATIDLKEAYYLLPIFPAHKKFLKFRFKHNYYQFTCLPFGLNTAPLIFTKIMRPVISYLRSRDLLLVAYLDGIIHWGANRTQCSANVHTTIALLTYLGFLINLEKSCLAPSTSCKYLGFIINSDNLTLCLTSQKKRSLLQQLKNIKLKKSFLIRTWAKLIGSLVAACPGVEYSPLHCK